MLPLAYLPLAYLPLALGQRPGEHRKFPCKLPIKARELHQLSGQILSRLAWVLPQVRWQEGGREGLALGALATL